MSKRILVVDDDPDIRQILRDRLASYGYSVETAIGGTEALDALRRETYDGMILDIQLPGIDGLEVLHQVRKIHPWMPVVLMTALEARENAIQSMREGAQALLLKPFDAAQLKQVVERWFRPPV